jgi:hypothetical protein
MTYLQTCSDDGDGAEHHEGALEEVVEGHGKVVVREAHVLGEPMR